MTTDHNDASAGTSGERFDPTLIERERCALIADARELWAESKITHLNSSFADMANTCADLAEMIRSGVEPFDTKRVQDTVARRTERLCREMAKVEGRNPDQVTGEGCFMWQRYRREAEKEIKQAMHVLNLGEPVTTPPDTVHVIDGRVINVGAEDASVYEGDRYVARFANRADARACVEAHNAGGDAVAWQRYDVDEAEWLLTKDPDVWRPRCKVRPLYAAPQPAADAWPYQMTFDAIAAAVTAHAKDHVGISVIKFREAMGCVPPGFSPTAPVDADTVLDLLTRADALLHDMEGEHANWAHALVHQAAAHLSDVEEIRAQAAAETPRMLEALTKAPVDAVGIVEQCAHYGGLPPRCLFNERKWAPNAAPSRCALCPVASRSEPRL